jgi:hypothetical protein
MAEGELKQATQHVEYLDTALRFKSRTLTARCESAARNCASRRGSRTLATYWTLFAQSNSWMARPTLLAAAGGVLL